MKGLTDTNSDLFGVTNSLNDVQRERLFQKDVRLFEVNGSESTNFTSFEATNRMIETALRVESTMMDDLSATIMDMLFLGQNMMDDLLTKGSTIADEFLVDLQDRKDGFVDSLTYTFLGITIVPIGGLIVGYCFIFAQYKIDLRNMFAFTKINKNAVENALVNLTQFQLFIQQNVNFENIHDDENCMNLLKNNNNSTPRNLTKLVDNSQSPNFKGFTKVYFVFALKVFFMLTLVTVTFVAYYIVFTDNLKSLGDKAYKLYYLDRVASRILLLRSGAFELALTNDTATINNAKVSVTLKEQILGLQSIQHQLQDFFDSEEDDMIKNIMFNDACEYLEDQVSAYSFCKVLGNYQNKASWINLISNIKGLFEEYLTSYELSDKSYDSLSALGKTYVTNIMRPVAGVTTAVNALLTDKINTEFTEINDQSKRLTSIMPAIYVVVILITLYIGLYEVIYPLNFKENRFRQLLLLFPANVVLSNFMLKSYLLKVSKGAFDSIHNDI